MIIVLAVLAAGCAGASLVFVSRAHAHEDNPRYWEQ